MNQTIEQQRAADAWRKVNGYVNSANANKNDKYAKCAEGLPASILANGLGQAAATLRAAGKSNEERIWLYNDLSDWLCRNDIQAPYPNQKDLLQAIVDHDRDAYIRAQAEALAWLSWLKKFAVAYLKKNV